MVTPTATINCPMATAMPTAADSQMVAAVVRPPTLPPLPPSLLKMVPAPRKLTPVTMAAATRRGSISTLPCACR